MNMFIPFLVASFVLLASSMRLRVASYILWVLLLLTTLIVLSHHATDALNISL